MQINPQLNSMLFETSSLDAKSLSKSLKKQKEVAQDFESVFTQMMLKEMRPKTESLLSAGQAEEMFYQFMDEAIAKEMAQSDSNFGIADAVMQDYF